ncbi:MAG: N-(5'-phosphoribosyl)anthranilate isomerase [Gemmatimonas sp.]|nr:N-(5'-phosphoribosyl)anthranilate isomerase [Gemmatimonas sp.]
MPEVKICGLTRPEDAAAAERAGATYGGVILAPGGPRSIDEARSRKVFAGTSLVRCGVFVDERPDRVAALVDRVGLDVVQLHGDEGPEVAEAIGRNTGVEVWKVIRVRTAQDVIHGARHYGNVVQGMLLDGWSEAARGGTGSRFPWQEVAEHRERFDPSIRLIAAGGLRPENVSELIALLGPDIVDVSSGVESAPGIKSNQLIRSFVAAAGRGAIRKEVL